MGSAHLLLWNWNHSIVWDYQRHTDCTEDLFRSEILQFEMLYAAYKFFMQVLIFFMSTVTSNVKRLKVLLCIGCNRKLLLITTEIEVNVSLM